MSVESNFARPGAVKGILATMPFFTKVGSIPELENFARELIALGYVEAAQAPMSPMQYYFNREKPCIIWDGPAPKPDEA